MRIAFALLLSLCVFFVTAQNTLNETIRQQMIKDWERAKAYTREYLDAMPAEKYGFHAADSIRTFAEQMLHLAQANAGMAFFGTSVQNPVAQKMFFKPNFEKQPTVQSKDSVAYYVTTSYDVMIDALKTMDFSKIEEVVTQNLPGGTRTAPRLAWLLKAFEHQTHHRGQCTIYLRLAGIRPPAEKLW